MRHPTDAPRSRFMKDLVRTIPRSSDAEDFARLRADPKVAETLGGALTREDSRRLLGRWIATWREEGLGPWIFREPASELLVGYAGLLPTESSRRAEFELAYALQPSFWGRGLCTQMARSALSDVTATRRPIEIVAWCLTTNVASKRVLEKLGFELDGHLMRAGLPHFAWRYSIRVASDTLPGAV